MSNACQVFVWVYHGQTMYNIKQAAARAGVSVPVLRAWERRYGIVAPERTPSGYRRFDDATVARVRTMRGLVDEGWSPSAAAAAILDGSVAVDRTPEPASSGLGPAASAARQDASDRDGAARPGVEADQLARELIAAAGEMDPVRVDAVLDDLFARGSFERVAVDLLFPALHKLGEAWAAGDLSVAAEHLASNAVLRRLGLALDAAGSHTSGGEAIVVGLPPGCRHELGALAFAVGARRTGIAVAYLGPDLPVMDWVTAAASARGAVIGVVSGRDRKGAIEVARALRAAHPNLVIAFGGRSAPEEPGVLRLPASLPASVEAFGRALELAG